MKTRAGSHPMGSDPDAHRLPSLVLAALVVNTQRLFLHARTLMDPAALPFCRHRNPNSSMPIAHRQTGAATVQGASARTDQQATGSGNRKGIQRASPPEAVLVHVDPIRAALP